MRYFYLMFVPYLVFATNDMFCLVCHENNKIDFSRLVSKKEWKSLTSDRGAKLQKIHKDNLDVRAYLKSKMYKEDALFNYIEFFSETQKEYDVKIFTKKCFVCHQNKLHLASLYTKKEWNQLNNSLAKLIHTHQYQLSVVKDLKSEQFKKILPEFIKKVSFHAANNKKHIRKKIEKKEKKYFTYKFETKSFDFIYKRKKGTEKEAKEIYDYVTKNVKKHTFKKPISIVLTESEWETDPGNAFMFIMTLGLASVVYTKEMDLSLTSDGTIYKSRKVLEKAAGGTIEGTEGLGMIKVIELLFDDLDKSTNHNSK